MDPSGKPIREDSLRATAFNLSVPAQCILSTEYIRDTASSGRRKGLIYG